MAVCKNKYNVQTVESEKQKIGCIHCTSSSRGKPFTFNQHVFMLNTLN